MTVNVINGDCREALKSLPDQSVNCCVTSPPYFGLRDYGHANQIGLEQTPEAYVAELVAVFSDVKRVLRDDGTLWLNLGDSYVGANSQHRESGSFGDSSCISKKTQGGIPQNGRIERNEKMKMEGARVDIRSKDHWANKEWGIVERVIGDEYHVAIWGDTKQCLVFAKKELRVTSPPPLKQKDLIGIPWRVAFALQADGWYLRQDIIWHKPNPMPESVTDRCTKAHEYVFMMSKSARYWYDHKAIMEPAQYGEQHANKATSWGTDRKHPNKANVDKYAHKGENSTCSKMDDGSHGRNKRSVWTVNTKPYKEAHFAVFPKELIRPCILAGCPQGGVVIDPFGGSGTTGEVAEQEGRNSILIELNESYIDLIHKRTAQQGLFV